MSFFKKEHVKQVDEIKILLKHCDQNLFLQPMLCATIFKSIFEFRILIPSSLGSSVTRLWICKFVNYKQMAFLQIFVSQPLLFLFSKHLDTMLNVTYCWTG